MEKKTDFKSLSTRAKFDYIRDYYKWHIVVAILAAGLVCYTVHYYATYRDPLLNVIMINCNDPYGENTSGFDEFQEALDYDPKEYPISISSSMTFPESSDGVISTADLQTLSTLVMAGGQDLFFGTGDMYLNYCEQGALADLSTILSSELLEKYEDSLIYSTADGELAPYPCAIELTDNAWLTKHNYYDACYFGIFYSNQNPDACKEFAEFLLTYDE